ncbi:MAG: tripartite tricarboxylate transporter substrate binding protein [Burkholderiales bacterium]|jgi:tripartite-type tricarboxylate transporter receptor subunit TctC|nr:tripartite tricarboxylate transporter substrate binding protein [Burkholderiales bacterium]
MRLISALSVATAAFATAMVPLSAALAQADYPSRSVRMIVPFAPGGISDVLGRLIAQRLGGALGQQVVVDNRPGAGTLIGAGIVTKANPDGHTIMIQDMTTHAINATLYARLPYDSVKDFTGITLVAQTPLMLVVNQGLPVKSVAELTALIRSRGGKFNYGSSGNGTILHLASESYRMSAKLEMAHIPYNGSGPAVASLLADQVGLVFSTMPAALPQVKAGKLRALAVTTGKRNASVPDVPTMIEAGVPNFDLVLYSGIMGPAGMQKAVVNRLYTELVKIMGLAEMRDTLSQQGAEAVTLPPDQFPKFIRGEIAKLGTVVKASGARID